MQLATARMLHDHHVAFAVDAQSMTVKHEHAERVRKRSITAGFSSALSARGEAHCGRRTRAAALCAARRIGEVGFPTPTRA
jgi:hypothetical protein